MRGPDLPWLRCPGHHAGAHSAKKSALLAVVPGPFRRSPTRHILGAAIEGEPSMFGFKKVAMPKPGEALPGRASPIRTAADHFVNHHPLKGPYPEGTEKAMFGLGCFWGAERKFWELGDGIHVTAVGYAGGMTPNPPYEE